MGACRNSRAAAILVPAKNGNAWLRRSPSGGDAANHGGNMRSIFVAVLFAGIVPVFGPANAADDCGPGCHSAPYGGCVANGWERGARIRNECPVGWD